MPGSRSVFGTRGERTRPALICALLLLATIQASAADARRVLLLHSFGRAYSPWSDIAESFHSDLIKNSSEPIDFYEVSLDTENARRPDQDRPFSEYIQALLGGHRLDLVVPVGAPAASFVQRHRAELFPATPMLIVGADQRRIPVSSLTPNDTAVFLAVDLPAYIANIVRLRPDVTEVAVVIGNSAIEKYWAAELSSNYRRISDQVNFIWLNDLSFDEILTRAAAMPRNYAILHFLLSEDIKGVPYSQERSLQALHEVSAVPIFGVGDYEMGRGIVGGPLIQSKMLGQLAAGAARQIFAGETPANIKIAAVGLGTPVYDWRELQRWNISEALLPRDSIVQFRETTAWQQYRWPILLAATVLFAQTLLVVYVLTQNRRRRAAEAEAAEQRHEVAHLMRVSVLGELSGAIAHEINQPLTAILSNAQAALHLLAQKSPDLDEVRNAIRDIVDENNRAGDVIERLRSLLRKGERKAEPVEINELAKSTITLLHSELIGRRIAVETDLANGLPPTSGDPVQLQQVLLNLLMNAMDAMVSTPDARRRITVRTRAPEAGAVELQIRDRGPGIRTDDQVNLFKPFYTSKEHGLGLGLTICSTIAQAHGGTLSLLNHGDSGAVALLKLPVQETMVAAK